jgi:proteasome lid subunit RPN8/RPN11
VTDARATGPRECCGLLIGTGRGIERIRRARNLAPSPTRFLIDPEDHFAAIREAHGEGRQVVGVYHSHPVTAPVPSQTDLVEASYSEYLYLIVSVRGEPAEVNLFRFEGGTFIEVPFRVNCDD